MKRYFLMSTLLKLWNWSLLSVLALPSCVLIMVSSCHLPSPYPSLAVGRWFARVFSLNFYMLAPSFPSSPLSPFSSLCVLVSYIFMFICLPPCLCVSKRRGCQSWIGMEHVSHPVPSFYRLGNRGPRIRWFDQIHIAETQQGKEWNPPFFHCCCLVLLHACVCVCGGGIYIHIVLEVNTWFFWYV